jgi:curli biogenesis system outer membrane secretion channel CsgG
MYTSTRVLGLVLIASLLAACGKQQAPAPEAVTTSESAPAKQHPLRTAPDFGGNSKVSRESEGVGSTPELAVLAALQSAVAQVNGVRVAGQMQSVRSSLHLHVDGEHVIDSRSSEFTQQMVAASQGAVLGYEILSQDEISQIDEEITARVRASDAGYSYSASASARGSARASAEASMGDAAASASAEEDYKFSDKVNAERGAQSYESDMNRRSMRSYWKVRVRADIAQYRAPDEQGRPKIVVALPRVSASSYAVGDGHVAADEVAQAIRSRLSDTLTQTNRFIVLDREFSEELQSEIDHINSGNVRLQDSARLGQQLATDLILIPSIEQFSYPRHVRQLRMSDRQLVSYSGGGRISLRLLNANTGQVVMSDSFEHRLAATGPSTLPRAVNGRGMAEAMMDSLSGQIGTAIVTGIFPISVVSLNGDQVVLSQGGQSLQPGQRWQAVRLGEELADPQTGRSLGRDERPCCTIRIDRVAAQTSYGTIEDGVDIGVDFVPGAIELRKQAPALSSARASAASGGGVSKPARASATPASARPAAAPAAEEPDPNW